MKLAGKVLSHLVVGAAGVIVGAAIIAESVKDKYGIDITKEDKKEKADKSIFDGMYDDMDEYGEASEEEWSSGPSEEEMKEFEKNMGYNPNEGYKGFPTSNLNNMDSGLGYMGGMGQMGPGFGSLGPGTGGGIGGGGIGGYGFGGAGLNNAMPNAAKKTDDKQLTELGKEFLKAVASKVKDIDAEEVGREAGRFVAKMTNKVSEAVDEAKDIFKAIKEDDIEDYINDLEEDEDIEMEFDDLDDINGIDEASNGKTSETLNKMLKAFKEGKQEVENNK